MRQVGVAETKATLSALLEMVRRGEVMVITSKGKPIAMLGPFLPLKAAIDMPAEESKRIAALQAIHGPKIEPTSAPAPIVPQNAQNQAGRPGLTLAEITKAGR